MAFRAFKFGQDHLKYYPVVPKASNRYPLGASNKVPRGHAQKVDTFFAGNLDFFVLHKNII